VALAALLALPVAAARAGTIYVTTTGDSGTGVGACSYAVPPVSPCSLRQALAFASRLDTISLGAPSPTVPYLLTQGELAVTKDVTIVGAGPRATIISAGGASRVFDIDPLSAGLAVLISGVTITGGNAESSSLAAGVGGGILSYSSSDVVTIDGSSIAGNTTGNTGANTYGGGIFSAGILNLTGDTIAGNTSIGTESLGGFGGGLYANGALNATDDTVASNTAGNLGEGTGGSGGGLWAAGTTVLANVTVARNAAVGVSGGPGGQGGNIVLLGTPLPHMTLRNTVIGDGATPLVGGGTVPGYENCYIVPGTTVTANDFNFDDTPRSAGVDQCGLNGTDKSGQSLALGALGDNGGPLKTIPLLPGSPAFRGGSPAGCTTATGGPLTVDERGVSRVAPAGRRCDAGAFQTGTSDIEVTGSAPAQAPVAGSVTFTWTVTNNGPDLVGPVTLTNVVPAGASLVSASALCSRGATVTCALGPMADGARIAVQVVLRRSVAGTLTNTAHIAAIAVQPFAGHNVATNSVAVIGPIVMTNVRESHRRWREGRSLARLAAARRPRVGTTFSFMLNEGGTVALTFRRGHRVVGTLSFSNAHAGLDRVRFSGRLSRRRWLATGTYTVAIVAENSLAERSQTRRMRFTVVP
jgi:uncharacterized repeat protein (TIGR01451 family)